MRLARGKMGGEEGENDGREEVKERERTNKERWGGKRKIMGPR